MSVANGGVLNTIKHSETIKEMSSGRKGKKSQGKSHCKSTGEVENEVTGRTMKTECSEPDKGTVPKRDCVSEHGQQVKWMGFHWLLCSSVGLSFGK